MMRILCLGNELLADDAFGLVAAEELRRRFPQMDVVFSTESGFHLLDYLGDIRLLVIVDSIQMGDVPPGTLHVMQGSDIKTTFGPSPHYVGLLETLQLAKSLLLNVPEEIIILAVEAADCLTLGGEMLLAVKSAVALVADLVDKIVQSWQPGSGYANGGCGQGLESAIATVAERWGSERIAVI
jgi:hydrogenase maturation protease